MSKLTQAIIKVLRADTSLTSILGGSNIFVTYNFNDTLDKQVNISLDYGESVAFAQDGDTHDGEFTIYVLVKDTISEPIKTMDAIAKRALEVIDLKGTTLDTESTIYWIQKLNSNINYYKELHFYEVAITFRFVITE